MGACLVAVGNFIEIYCRCPVEVRENRDVKGLYKRARAGEIKEFTGISSPCETPQNPELVLDTSQSSLDDCVDAVMALLLRKGIISRP